MRHVTSDELKPRARGILFWIAVVIFSLLVVYAIALANDTDEPLSTEILKEIEILKPVLDEKNAFYSFLGLPKLGQVDDLHEAGRDIVLNDFEEFQTLELSNWYKKNPIYAPSFLLKCKSSSASCIDQNQAQANDAFEWRGKNKDLVSAVQKIVESDTFFRQFSWDAHYFDSWYLLNTVRQSQWAIATDFWIKGEDKQAIASIKSFMHFCRGLLKTNSTLSTRNSAIACVVDDMRLVADWYVRMPNKRDRLSAELHKWLRPIGMDEIRMREPLSDEGRLITRAAKAFPSGSLTSTKAKSANESAKLEKLDLVLLQTSAIAKVMAFFVKPNDIARWYYKKFDGMLYWADSGAAIAKPLWQPNESKPWQYYLTRNYYGLHLANQLEPELYEHYLHNAQSPLVYQTLLKAVIKCAAVGSGSDNEDCLKNRISEFKGPFYVDAAKWYEDKKFLYLPTPDVQAIKYGEARMYLSL